MLINLTLRKAEQIPGMYNLPKLTKEIENMWLRPLSKKIPGSGDFNGEFSNTFKEEAILNYFTE